MPVTRVEKDLLDATENIIALEVDLKGTMNFGLAKNIRDRFPEVFLAYSTLILDQRDPSSLMGTHQIVKVGDKSFICNLFCSEPTNKRFAKKNEINLEYFKQALDLLKIVAEGGNFSVALPYRAETFDIVEETFKDSVVIIKAYGWG